MGNDVHCLRPKNGTSAALEPNCFKVRNVNESGHVVNKGYLEVTQTDLILHVINAETVKWPLRCLRRYGHDANLFSFESGRRCATGPGIYAFKSKYAIQIFRLVQENAQHTEENATSPTTPNIPTSRTSRQRSLSNDTALPPSQTMSRASSNASGVNGAAHGVANGNLSPHPSVGSNLSFPSPTSPGPLYFNGNGSINNCLRMSPISPTMQYMNSSAFGDIAESPLEATPEANGVIPEEASSHNVSADSFGDPALNYARLKLPSDEDQNNVGDAQKNTDDERINPGGRKPKEQDVSDEEKEDSRIGKNEEEVGDGGSGAKDNNESGIVAELENSGENQSNDKASGLGCDSEVGADKMERKLEKETNSKEEVGKYSSLVSDLNLEDDESSKNKVSGDDVKEKADVSHVTVDEEESNKIDVRLKVKKNGKREVSDIERTALLQDFANGNIRLKDRNVDAESKLNILVNYANLTEQQIQDVLQKLETSRNGNISPCTVCSNSSSNASQRVSPLSYYANLDTAGELPPNWHPNGFQFYPELRTPRSTSSKGSTGSEFTFEVNRGSCSPVDHNYANLDTLPEVQPLRHSLSSSGATNGAGNWMILQPPPKGKVNYIQLDFDENDQPVFTNVKTLRRSMSSSTSTTPPKTPVSPPTEIVPTVPCAKNDIYARIDIEKTVALANTHRQPEGDTDISTRRTRHDVWTDNKTR